MIKPKDGSGLAVIGIVVSPKRARNETKLRLVASFALIVLVATGLLLSRSHQKKITTTPKEVIPDVQIKEDLQGLKPKAVEQVPHTD